jgi:hypothetical protein
MQHFWKGQMHSKFRLGFIRARGFLSGMWSARRARMWSSSFGGGSNIWLVEDIMGPMFATGGICHMHTNSSWRWMQMIDSGRVSEEKEVHHQTASILGGHLDPILPLQFPRWIAKKMRTTDAVTTATGRHRCSYRSRQMSLYRAIAATTAECSWAIDGLLFAVLAVAAS